MSENRTARQFYSEDQRRLLLEKYKVPSELAERVISHLEESAGIWKRNLGYNDLPVRRKRAKAKWQELYRLARNLAAALDDMPEEVFARFNAMAAVDVPQAIVAKGDVTERGLPIFRSVEGNSFFVMDPEDMFCGVRYIRDRAEEEVANYRPLPKGKWFDYPLHLWMANMEVLWREILGKSFTRDVAPNGEPITPAAEFVVDAFGVLDPNMPKKTILNQMRKTIQSERRSRQK